MSIKISYKNNQSKTSSNLVLFVDEKFSVLNLKKHISGQEYSFIIDLIKTKDKKKNIIIFDVSSKRKIILVSSKKNSTGSAIENLGAKFYDLFKDSKLNDFNINSDRRENLPGVWVQNKNGINKIGAVGIRISKWIAYHGISININPDLSKYEGIIPCGVTDAGVTSASDLGYSFSFKDFDNSLALNFEKLF